MAYKIVRRSFGEYHEVETLEVSWVAAMNIAMKMEAYNGNGEYLVYGASEEVPRGAYCAPCPVQAAFAYL